MSQLPGLPQSLTLYPTPLSLEQRTAAPGAGTLVDDRMTFAGLWQLLAHHDDRRSLSPLSACGLVRALLPGSALEAHGADAWGVHMAHAALMELRLAGITARHLQRHELSPEVAAVAELLAQYEHRLAAERLYDEADVQRQAVFDVAQGVLPVGLSEVRAVDVLAGQDLLGARLDLLSALAARGIAVTVRLPWDAQRPGAFAWPEALAHGVESRGHAALQVRFDDRVGSGPLAPLRAAQWTEEQLPASTPASVRQVGVGCEHAQQVVWQVSQWLGAGVPASQIAVVTPDAALKPELRAAFASAGVPLAGRLRNRLADAPLLRRWRAAWNLPAQGFVRAAVMDVWQAAGRAIQTPEGPWYPDLVAWELCRAGWRSARLQPVTEALRRTAPEAAEPVGTALQAWCDLWSQVPEEGSTVTFAAATRAAWEALATPGDGDALQAGHGLVNALESMPGPPWSKAEWMSWLRLGAEDVLLPGTPQPAGAVRLLGPEEAVGARFGYVVFAGANLGVFPRQREADAVLTDGVRAALNKLMGPRLLQYGPLSGRGALPAEARDLWLWQELLLCCQQELVVTVASAPGEETLGHSEVVEELLRSLGRKQVPGAPASYTRGGTWPLAWLPTASLLRPQAPAAGTAATLTLRQRCVPRQARLAAASQSRLEAQLLTQVQSTSRLDVLGMCAFRYFAQGALGLGQQDVPTLSADAREQGSAAHAGLHRVYRDLQAQGGLREARLQPEAALQRAHAVFTQEADHVLAEVQVHPLLREATLQQAWLAVQAQLRRDLNARTPTEVKLLEHAFDDREGAATPELTLAHPAGGRPLRVRGSIDRVDVDVDSGVLWTLDYKRTVSKRSPERHFQLGLYSAVASRDLQPAGDSVQAAWIALADGRRTLADGLGGEAPAVHATMATHLWTRIDRVLGGDVTPDPDTPALCERCDFRALCRYDAGAAELETAVS